MVAENQQLVSHGGCNQQLHRWPGADRHGRKRRRVVDLIKSEKATGSAIRVHVYIPMFVYIYVRIRIQGVRYKPETCSCEIRLNCRVRTKRLCRPSDARGTISSRFRKFRVKNIVFCKIRPLALNTVTYQKKAFLFSSTTLWSRFSRGREANRLSFVPS